MGLEAVDADRRRGRGRAVRRRAVRLHPFIQGPAPAPLALSSGDASDPPGHASAADGTWTVGGDSLVGYRIDETIFGQGNVAVGRTSTVTGNLTIAGGSVTDAKFTVDMTSVTSDGSRRDDHVTTEDHGILEFRLAFTRAA